MSRRGAARTRVVVAGATGVVGRECVRQLLARPDVDVVALVRRADAFAQAPRLAVAIIDLARLEPAPFEDADAVLCALGTTLRAAGSEAAFRRVDLDGVAAVARAGRDAGAQHFGLVSAIGADARSRIFYTRTKGEAERAVRQVGYPSLTIVRPSLLVGERTEFRPAEALMRVVGVVAPSAWRPVSASRVAAALVRGALERQPGAEIVENAALRREPVR